MSRFLIAGAVLLVALGVASGASAAPKKASAEHNYYWIDTPKAEREYACQARDLWALINRGDLCQAYDQSTSPPIYTP